MGAEKIQRRLLKAMTNQELPPEKEKQVPDFYVENGFHVFTEIYHLKRGYCCVNNCRHCPWKNNISSDHKNKPIQ